MHLAPAGDRALLVELGEVTAAELHAASARASSVRGVAKSVPGHSSLYVIFGAEPDRDALLEALKDTSRQQPATSNRTQDVPVHFDGPDLVEFLDHVNLTRAEFVSRADGLRLTARYLGFRGGFAYLDGWPEEWSMVRRATSRPVRRGSFAIAGSVAAVYPIDTPGGWNVLGTTDADLENAIAAGDVLSLRVIESSSRREEPRRLEDSKTQSPVEVMGPTLAMWTTTPFDTTAAAIANRAAGNEASDPLFECAFAGPRLRFPSEAVVAWCTPSLDVTIERVRPGEERAFGRVSDGLRAYLAIGDREGVRARLKRDDRRIIRAVSGPHDLQLGDVECEVTSQLDRVGIRLRPLRDLGVLSPGDLRSIGMQCGTVQLHPDGSLVAMGPDHPVTGGYLQPMTVLFEERWKLAQLVPGERIVFVCR